ncbi:unnamed protein product [Amoebophrya sp. A120]|nr:unnamed protein product [Amoebophrya sp. A120]|eukprot:GSA120T00002903001.1
MVASDDEELLPTVVAKPKDGGRSSTESGSVLTRSTTSQYHNFAVDPTIAEGDAFEDGRDSRGPHAAASASSRQSLGGEQEHGQSGTREMKGKEDELVPWLRYLDPVAQFARLTSWLQLLVDTYGWRLCAILVLSQHVLKGFVFSYLATSIDFALKFYQVSGPRIQIYKAVTLAPWALKPLFGVLSDRCPIFGYHKNSYMVLVTLVAMCASGYVGVQGLLHYELGSKADHSALPNYLPLNLFVFCYFTAYLQVSVCDLLTEARYAEAMRERPEHGPDLMTFVWGGISIGAFLGTLTIGYVLENLGPFFPSVVVLFVSSLMLYPLFRNWLQERKDDGEQVEPRVDQEQQQQHERPHTGIGTSAAEPSADAEDSRRVPVHPHGGTSTSEIINLYPAASSSPGANNSSLRRSNEKTTRRVAPELVFLSFFMGFCALALVGSGLMESLSTRANFGFAICVSVMALFCFQLFCSPAIANMNFFTFLQTAMSMSIEGATFYFFTDSEEEYPDGPHFSIWFYTTGIGIVASVFNLVGMLIYNQRLKTWRYHKLFMVANVAQCVFALLGILVFTRVSKHVLGIPDHLFILGGSVILSIVHQWMWLPGVVLLSQLCPKGCEATMYALLAGCHNIGNGVGQIFGAYVLEALHVQPDGSKKDAGEFGNLWLASVIGTVLPMFSLVMLPYFIPNATQQEVLLNDDDDGVKGSWWHRYKYGTKSAGPVRDAEAGQDALTRRTKHSSHAEEEQDEEAQRLMASNA